MDQLINHPLKNQLKEQLINIEKYLKPYLPDQLLELLSDEESRNKILIGVSIISAMFLFSKVFGSSNKKSGNSSTGKTKKTNNKKSKSKKNKNNGGFEVNGGNITTAKVEVIDPVTRSNLEIESVLNKLNTEFVPSIESFFKEIETRLEEINKKSNGDNSSVSSKGKKSKGKKSKKQQQQQQQQQQQPQQQNETSTPGSTSYKDDLNYRYLYFNENLLKLLMRLDSVEAHGNDELRQKRKEAIRRIQNYHSSIDEVKPKIEIIEKASAN
ncbi:unnamed protein product [[Candida] boidinii]|nr:hypothetical protein BVG19_g3603 [[Candida] boidinii]OWB52328.1 hypothetical protein B5S27_g3902 [[Candida] boidinii]GMF02299.1 unnamed protein product [[Candida] boidinii]